MRKISQDGPVEITARMEIRIGILECSVAQDYSVQANGVLGYGSVWFAILTLSQGREVRTRELKTAHRI
jgi:hypothetical protein